MSWIQERLDAKKKAQKDWATISNNAIQTYEQLWTEIYGLVTEATNLGMPVTTNGNQLARAVYMAVRAKYGQLAQSRELTISLDRERHLVAAESDVPSVTLNLSLCDDGVVCLKHNGEQVSLADAARLILEPFLFPADDQIF